MALLEVTGLSKFFPFGGGVVRAVEDVSFEVARGVTLGLVGESGCGKTTTARCVLRLIEPDSGSIRFDGEEVTLLGARRMRAMRRRMQIVFQSPRHSLEGGMKIRALVEEGLRVHGLASGAGRRQRAEEALERVGLSPDLGGKYPHQLSGGQLQRVAIARAVVLEPALMILDEPVSALDVSVRANVLNLLRDLQARLGLTYIMIGHDLAVVRFLSDVIAVMYLGRIVELAPADELFERPLHPYTQVLIRSIPSPDPQERGGRAPLPGTPPSPLDPPEGCPFHTRCESATPRCAEFAPELHEITPGHSVACRLCRPEPCAPRRNP